MNAETLQINDYVLTPDDKIAQVQSIIYDTNLNNYLIEVFTNGEGKIYEADKLKPMSMTAEILKKYHCKYRDFNSYSIDFNLFWQDNSICTSNSYDDYIILFDCRYVHEFQHLLQLMGKPLLRL